MTRPFPELLTMGLDQVTAFVAGADDVCISISYPPSNVTLSPNFREVLRVHFADAPWPETADHEHQINAAIADEILQFAERHRDARRLVIHCAAGASRSVSTAQALSVHLARRWWFPLWFKPAWRLERFVPNPIVFNAIALAFARAHPGERVIHARERDEVISRRLL